MALLIGKGKTETVMRKNKQWKQRIDRGDRERGGIARQRQKKSIHLEWDDKF